MFKKICTALALIILFLAISFIEQRPDIGLRLISLSCLPVYFGKLWERKGGER
jgi:hypothetical protein